MKGFVRAALLAFVLAIAIPLADTPAYAVADQATLATYGGQTWYWPCDTVNCRERQASGTRGSITFHAGDTVIAWNVRPENRYDLRPHPCIWENAPTWGVLYDGVRNPWWQELEDARRRGWPHC